jgi:hypothetical protein
MGKPAVVVRANVVAPIDRASAPTSTAAVVREHSSFGEDPRRARTARADKQATSASGSRSYQAAPISYRIAATDPRDILRTLHTTDEYAGMLDQRIVGTFDEKGIVNAARSS